MTTDRDWLIAVLALQNEVVTKPEFFSVVNSWMQNKSRSLVEGLQELPTINRGVYRLLHQMMEMMLLKSQGDVHACLASLVELTSIREDMLSLQDADIHRLLTGNSHVSSDETFVPTGDYESGQPWALLGSGSTPNIQAESRFQVLRRHARGGLGEIFLARDEELNRDVALKEIQLRFADDMVCRNRFVLEAEVTGGLEHPGIVPVYALGHYDDGRPYYVMRFIKGDSLKQAIDDFHQSGSFDTRKLPRSHKGIVESDRLLAFRKLLGRFMDVCQAVAYAHSRGVVHRDLKPANIMLGRYGETLVVDWGLAKILGKQQDATPVDEQPLTPASGSGETPTIHGTAVGTPAFMSPEQAAGRVDKIGEASDVYSLGATLYNLLTGAAPFSQKDDWDIQRLLAKVIAGAFPQPRQVNPRIPLALEAVCLKAMARQPADRYSTPAALADEIERWLADEPVLARKESTIERCSRFYRRQGLAFILGCVFILGNVLMSILMTAAAARIDAARNAAELELDGVLRTMLGTVWRNPLVLCLPLIFLTSTFSLKYLARWLYGTVVTFPAAAAITLLIGTISVPSPAIEVVLGWPNWASVALSWVATFPVVVVVIARVLSLSVIRVWGLLVLMGLVNSLFTIPLIKNYAVKSYLAVGNAMGPTVRGNHHIGVCQYCQGRLIIGHSPHWCSVCIGDDGETLSETTGEDFPGICEKCLRSSATADVSTVVRSPDRILVNLMKSPDRWDLICYRTPTIPHTTNVHRIVGMPGETITIVDGVIHANGQPLPMPEELKNLRYPIPLGAELSEMWGTTERPAHLGANEFFVIGDNAAISNDSRSRQRTVPLADIEGVVETRFWPLWRYHSFN